MTDIARRPAAESHSPSRANRASSGFRADIEGLRAVAILLVVCFHAGAPGFGGGFVGVDVFFVLSGYLITGLLIDERERTGRIDFARFYARRARRLLPAATVMLVVTLIAVRVLVAPNEQFIYAHMSRAAAAYLGNVWLIIHSQDYFAPPTTENPFVHTWTLAVEEQFYLCWPILIAIGMRLLKTRRRIGWMFASVSALSLVACFVAASSNRQIAFYSSPTRAWEFGLGALGALVPATWDARVATRVIGAGAIAALAAIVASAMMGTETSRFPLALPLVPAVATVVLLIAGTASARIPTNSLLGSAPLQTIGRLSYSWYLWHWPALVLVRAGLPGSDAALGIALTVGAALAVVSYYVVERPARASARLARGPRSTLVLAGALPLIAIGIASVEIHWATVDGNRPAQRRFVAAREQPEVYALDCVGRHDEAAVRRCVFGDTGSATTIVLFGDSHAMQWFPAIERIATDRRWRLVTIAKSACAVARVAARAALANGPPPACSAWREAALLQIAKLHPVLLVTSASQTYIAGRVRRGAVASVSYDDWSRGLRSTLVTLDSLAVRTLVIRDTPLMEVNVPACVAARAWRGLSGTAPCGRPRVAALDATLDSIERRAVSGLADVHRVDLSDSFCDAAWCDATRGGYILYRDRDHITTAYAATVAPMLGDMVVALAGEARAATRLP